MPDYVSAVYEPNEPDMPLVAVILEAGEVKVTFTVASVDEGERRIRRKIHGLRIRAETAEQRWTMTPEEESRLRRRELAARVRHRIEKKLVPMLIALLAIAVVVVLVSGRG